MAIQPDPDELWTEEDTKLAEEQIKKIESFDIDRVMIMLSISSAHRPCGLGCKACLYNSRIVQALGARVVELGKQDEEVEMKGLSRENN